MQNFLCIAAYVFLAAPPEADRVAGPGQNSSLNQAIDGIWKDAAVGNDSVYQSFINKTAGSALAPLDMRRIVCAWPQPRNLRGRLQQMHVSFERGRVALKWNGELGSGEQAESSRQRFAAALEKQGYRPLNRKQQELFEQELGSRVDKGYSVFMRTAGETELLVSFAALSYTGSPTYRSGVTFTWLIRRNFQSASPKLSEVFAVLPRGIKVDYLDDKFYASLGDEPILSLSSGRDLKIQFARPAKQKLITALEEAGFEYRHEGSPHSDGSTQKTWYRFSDITFAHVITSADGQGLRFYCQFPQHHGEPIAVKPPPLHPSLRLPPEKRPILAFEQLPFANRELQRQAKIFHELAEGLTNKGWHTQQYKDTRYSSNPYYTAYWQSSVVTSSTFTRNKRPYRGISIALEGQFVDGKDRLNTLNVHGTIVPREGWAAQVGYNVSLSPDGVSVASISATTGLARDDQVFSFGNFSLTSPYVTVSVSESKSFHYRFHAQLERDDLSRGMRKLFRSPETFRDELVVDFASLRKQARDQLNRKAGITATDLRNVRSDRPPQEFPVSERSPSADTIQALLKKVEAQLAAQEKLVRENFRELHAAVQQALPLNAIHGDLVPRQDLAPEK